MGTCSDWALNPTFTLIKRNKVTKKYIKTKKWQTSKFFTKITKSLPKLITNIPFFLLFKSVSSFNWAFKRNCWPLVRNLLKTGRLIDHLRYLYKLDHKERTNSQCKHNKSMRLKLMTLEIVFWTNGRSISTIKICRFTKGSLIKYVCKTFLTTWYVFCNPNNNNQNKYMCVSGGKC